MKADQMHVEHGTPRSFRPYRSSDSDSPLSFHGQFQGLQIAQRKGGEDGVASVFRWIIVWAVSHGRDVEKVKPVSKSHPVDGLRIPIAQFRRYPVPALYIRLKHGRYAGIRPENLLEQEHEVVVWRSEKATAAQVCHQGINVAPPFMHIPTYDGEIGEACRTCFRRGSVGQGPADGSTPAHRPGGWGMDPSK